MNNSIRKVPDLVIGALTHKYDAESSDVYANYNSCGEKKTSGLNLIRIILSLRSFCLGCVFVPKSCVSAYEQEQANTSFYLLLSHASSPVFWDADLPLKG